VPPTGRPEPGSAQDWVEWATADLVLASIDLPEGARCEALAFLAQQAAEKALKAVHVHIGRPFRYTHNLRELVLGLEAGGVGVPDAVRACARLTTYAAETRHPGAQEAVTEQELREAVEIATAVVEWAASVIEGTPSGPA
jgi:HEPN domain-containing protein